MLGAVPAPISTIALSHLGVRAAGFLLVGGFPQNDCLGLRGSVRLNVV